MFLLLHRVKYWKKVPLGTGTGSNANGTQPWSQYRDKVPGTFPPDSDNHSSALKADGKPLNLAKSSRPGSKGSTHLLKPL